VAHGKRYVFGELGLCGMTLSVQGAKTLRTSGGGTRGRVRVTSPI
jgi:hypothetical protein